MPLARLWSWLRRRPAPRAPLHFVVYTRRGCHLCDDAWQCLNAEQQRYPFTLEAIDVDTDPELAAQYGEWVPVVTVNGKVRFRGGVNVVLLRRLLRGGFRG
jgi:glutaredoxin